VEAEFPVEALKAKRLKEIRLELLYFPSSYRQETMSFGVSIGSSRVTRFCGEKLWRAPVHS
jgi:hypothetical protein